MTDRETVQLLVAKLKPHNLTALSRKLTVVPDFGSTLIEFHFDEDGNLTKLFVP